MHKIKSKELINDITRYVQHHQTMFFSIIEYYIERVFKNIFFSLSSNFLPFNIQLLDTGISLEKMVWTAISYWLD